MTGHRLEALLRTSRWLVPSASIGRFLLGKVPPPPAGGYPPNGGAFSKVCVDVLHCVSRQCRGSLSLLGSAAVTTLHGPDLKVIPSR